jgi:hypothetical protein
MPGQQPRPNKIPIANLRTEDECDAYIKAEAISLREHSARRHGRAVNPVNSYMHASFILSALKRKDKIRADARAAEIAASDPNDEPATTVFVSQDGTIGVSK